MRYIKFQKSSKTFHYHIADTIYQTNHNYHELSHLLIKQNKDECSQNQNHLQQYCDNIIYNDAAVIGDKYYHLKINFNQGCYQVNNDNDFYFIDNNSITSHRSNPDIMLLMGPLTMLNLALNKVFCLHASAFNYKNKTIVLMAKSGTGKSTIARHINSLNCGLRVADDIVPLTFNDKKLMLLPHFPQLKIATKNQYQGESLTNEIILIFAQQSQSTNIKLEALNSFHGTKKIISHSVATKLFAKSELENHLLFSHQLSQTCRSYQLNYSHHSNSLDDFVTQLNEIC